MFWLMRIALGFVVLLAAAVVIERIAETIALRRHPAPGRLVRLANGQTLHLLCEGAGPTVIVEQGAGEPAILWRGLQRRASSFSRFCIYDRAGYGWSPPAPAFQTVDERAADLRALLTAAGVPGPYIVIAHSYGGLIARSFARQFPDASAGLVMVDAVEESIAFHPEYLAFLRSAKPFVWGLRGAAGLGLLRLFGPPGGGAEAPMIDGESRAAAASLAAAPSHFAAVHEDLRSIEEAALRHPLPVGMGPLGDIPLIAITHGRPFPGPFSRLEPFWRPGQERLARLSTRSELIVAEQSNHMVAFEQPELVLGALRRMVETVALRRPAG
jgi:pimeloyl-ACP methyl ester carboxylesterase